LCGSGSGSTHGFKIQPEPAPVGLKTRGLPETRTRIAIPNAELMQARASRHHFDSFFSYLLINTFN
jgi:hypothetical protein